MSVETLDRQMEDLPPLPVVVVQALQVFNDPEFEFERLEAVVGKDQSLVSHVLKIANSPFYGLTGKVSSLKEAFIILGSNTLRNLILGVSIMRQLGDAEGTVLEQGRLWMHAYGAAMIARRLALEIPHVDEEAAFVAGLLHDIGKAFMNICFTDDVRRIVEHAEANDCLYLDAERQLVAIDHAFVGERLARRWHLSADIATAIGQHHDAGTQASEPLADIVHVADSLCRALGFGYSGDDGVTPIDPAVLDRLGIDIATIERVMMDAYPQLCGARDFLQQT